jgi:4-amino-4-deoxy-L-arabinose transferase-like glycosyltransferase
MIAPIIGGLVVAVLLYVVFAALFGSTAGVIAVAVLALLGFLGFVGSLIVSMR